MVAVIPLLLESYPIIPICFAGAKSSAYSLPTRDISALRRVVAFCLQLKALSTKLKSSIQCREKACDEWMVCSELCMRDLPAALSEMISNILIRD